MTIAMPILLGMTATIDEATHMLDSGVSMSLVGLALGACATLGFMVKVTIKHNTKMSDAFISSLRERHQVDIKLSESLTRHTEAITRQTEHLEQSDRRSQEFQDKLFARVDALHDNLHKLADRNYEAIQQVGKSKE